MMVGSKPIFSKISLARLVFVKYIYTEFDEYQVSALVTVKKSQTAGEQMDKQGLQIKLSFFFCFV
jgi:hypothetical protein